MSASEKIRKRAFRKDVLAAAEKVLNQPKEGQVLGTWEDVLKKRNHNLKKCARHLKRAQKRLHRALKQMEKGGK